MGIIRDMQRAHATQVAAEQRAGTAAAQQRELIRRNADLALAAAQQAAADAQRRRESRRLYAEARAADAAAANADVRARLSDLDTLLLSTLDVDDHIDLSRFKKPANAPPFDPGPLGRPLPEPSWASYAPPESHRMGRIGDRLRQHQMDQARRAFREAHQRWTHAEERRQRRLTERERAYERHRSRYQARIKAYNAEVDRFAAAVAGADPESVVEYFAMVLGNSVYPDDFPQHFRLAYLPKRKRLLIEYHLPPVEVIPIVKEHRYDRTSDDVVAVPRDEAEIRHRYIDIIAQVTLRTIHEIIEADRGALVSEVLFNGIVDAIDRRTGRFVRPCLVSVRTDRDTFAAIKLRRVDPVACLKHLHGGLSMEPDELTGVPPTLDFDRDAEQDLTGEFNVLAELDERPNLPAMPENEFEHLLTDLFVSMGLAAGTPERVGDRAQWLATDPRPLMGGTVVIHAVRHQGVGDTAIGALAEAVTRAGGTKGIMITLGGYEPGVPEAVSGRPIELIDGATLLSLLSEHCRLKARIEPR
ncbi:restriction endonuclease [Mangrovihabitans endophyticus]|uniref:Restriction endonuclease n=1 Tax=Mangrovihabitans endophyticus TaxID=1751298 RepID=A0A8J3BXB3_9ACTN|nr:restriction endonuclease [Mangrovihabitans endophyticus]GGK87050.1 restriction endonuclease [Mangrovihabitans endophyticus]